MRTANEIASWFLARAEDDDAEISNLKVQKLLYYVQGHSLGSAGTPVFADKIYAWAHGPVVTEVYHRFKSYGAGPIDFDDCIPDSFDWDDYRDVEDLLESVWKTYGPQEAWVLRNRTHREAPWIEAFETGSHNPLITNESMERFFSTVQ